MEIKTIKDLDYLIFSGMLNNLMDLYTVNYDEDFAYRNIMVLTDILKYIECVDYVPRMHLQYIVGQYLEGANVEDEYNRFVSNYPDLKIDPCGKGYN